MIWLGILIASSAFMGWFGAWILRHHAEHIGLMSDPNHRSSHAISTPHGGGVGIAISGLLSFCVLELVLPFEFCGYWWLALSACAFAAILSLLDDFRHVHAGLRLFFHLIIAVTVVIAFYPLPSLDFNFFDIGGLLLVVLVCGTLLWWINLYNFMDGIDGIAGTQALFMLLAAAGLLLLRNPYFGSDPVFWWLLCLGGACAGFLIMNWPPAKIFMGDVGSVFLGTAIAVAVLHTISCGWLSYQSWLILGAAFIADASVMLVIRLLKREPLHQAHRNHAYQRISRKLNAHKPATLLFALVNAVWLLPLAVLSILWPAYGWLLAGVAYLPLLLGCLYVQKNYL